MTTSNIKSDTITVTPLEDKPLGCTVTLPAYCHNDPSLLNEEDHKKLYEAVLTYLVVVIPGQGNFSPKSQYNLTKSFDSSLKEEISYGHEDKILANDKSILKRDLITIKEQPEVHVLGHGVWNDPKYGKEDINLKHPTHFAFHKEHLPKEKCFDVPEGEIPWTRFYRWHIDSALYKLYPPKITTLLGLKVPSKRQKAIIKSCMHLTHTYTSVNVEQLNDGLTICNEGKELGLDELPPWEEKHIMKLPLVWTNPVTGKHHLQVHGCCVYKLYLPNGEVLELEKARELIYKWMKPAINPEHVYAHEWTNGELCIFYNRGCLALRLWSIRRRRDKIVPPMQHRQ
ncbi:unnamed protein product [Hanseniaspora opuntiae]